MTAGRKPKLTRAQADRLIYRHTTGTSRRELMREFHLSDYAVRCYINETHKAAALRRGG